MARFIITQKSEFSKFTADYIIRSVPSGIKLGSRRNFNDRGFKIQYIYIYMCVSLRGHSGKPSSLRRSAASWTVDPEYREVKCIFSRPTTKSATLSKQLKKKLPLAPRKNRL